MTDLRDGDDDDDDDDNRDVVCKACVQNIANPICLARKVMECTPDSVSQSLVSQSGRQGGQP